MAPKVSKGRRLTSGESAEGGSRKRSDNDRKAERVSRNEWPTAATIEAADAARRRETSAFGKVIVLSEHSLNHLHIID